jgi:hypothetical protein
MDFTARMDLAGPPAICLPLVYRIANAYEEATSWHTRHPDLDGQTAGPIAFQRPALRCHGCTVAFGGRIARLPGPGLASPPSDHV